MEVCRKMAYELDSNFEELGAIPTRHDVPLLFNKAKHYKDRTDRLIKTFGNISGFVRANNTFRRIYNSCAKIRSDNRIQILDYVTDSDSKSLDKGVASTLKDRKF